MAERQSVPKMMKRGRKPLKGIAMSQAERKRRSREKLKNEGGREVWVRIDGSQMDAIEVISERLGVSPEEFTRRFYKKSLSHFLTVLKQAGTAQLEGANEEETIDFIRKHLFPSPPNNEAKEEKI